MARLTTIKPRIASLGQRVATHTYSDTRERGRPWQRKREQVLRLNPLCVHCSNAGRVTMAVEVDHVVPREDGGSDEPSNLQGLCTACHQAKSAEEARRRAGKA